MQAPNIKSAKPKVSRLRQPAASISPIVGCGDGFKDSLYGGMKHCTLIVINNPRLHWYPDDARFYRALSMYMYRRVLPVIHQTSSCIIAVVTSTSIEAALSSCAIETFKLLAAVLSVFDVLRVMKFDPALD